MKTQPRTKRQRKTIQSKRSIKANKKDKASKKMSFKKTVDKIVEIVKKPISKVTSKSKRRREKILVAKEQPEQNRIDQQKNEKNSRQNQLDVPFAEKSSGQSYSHFFFSNDETINNFDDEQLYHAISKHYTGLLATEENEKVKRMAIVNMLDNEKFMERVLKDYNMTILDFFKFLFRLCPSVFKGLFIRKIQKTISGKSYAKSLNFGKYSYRGQRKASRKCSIF